MSDIIGNPFEGIGEFFGKIRMQVAEVAAQQLAAQDILDKKPPIEAVGLSAVEASLMTNTAEEEAAKNRAAELLSMPFDSEAEGQIRTNLQQIATAQRLVSEATAEQAPIRNVDDIDSLGKAA